MAKSLNIHPAGENERIRRIVGGDAGAFRALVRDYHALAYGLAHKVLGDSQDAEEVVQDAFIKVHQALDGFRGEASLKTWILRIVLRLSLNRRRDRARGSWHRLGLHLTRPDEERRPAAEPRGAPAQNPESEYMFQETRQLLLDLVNELPDSLREALILNSFEELSYEEIARVLQVPLGTVSSRIHAARHRLLKKLRHYQLV